MVTLHSSLFLRMATSLYYATTQFIPLPASEDLSCMLALLCITSLLSSFCSCLGHFSSPATFCTHVYLLMGPHVRTGSRRVIAPCALVWPLSCVPPFVYHQVALDSRRVWAQTTVERLFSCMLSFMDGESNLPYRCI